MSVNISPFFIPNSPSALNPHSASKPRVLQSKRMAGREHHFQANVPKPKLYSAGFWTQICTFTNPIHTRRNEGIVFLATHNQIQRVVKRTKKSDAIRVKQYEVEKKFLMNAIHPGIVKLLGYGEDGMYLYLLLEFIPHTLKDMIRTPSMNWRVALPLLHGIASSMQFIHTKKGNTIGSIEKDRNKPLVYCDLKPENILVNEEENVKICDFGALCVEGTSADSAITTEGFTGPEFKRRRYSAVQNVVTQKADSYSFGVIIIQLMLKDPEIKGEQFTNEKEKKMLQFLVENGCQTATANKILTLVKLCMEQAASRRPNMSEICNSLLELLAYV